MEGKFNGRISAQFTAPKTWVLEKPLSFETRSLGKHEVDLLARVGAKASSHNSKILGKVTCEKGMKTDLASVPRLVWSFISPWDVARAAVIHDHLYASLRGYYHNVHRVKKRWRAARKLSDNVFLWAMQSSYPPVPKYKIWCAYYAVRIFGRWPASAKPDQAEK